MRKFVEKMIALSMVLILLLLCLVSCNFFEYLPLNENEETTNICYAVGSEAPEAHDWQYKSQTSDCWSTTVIHACSKCGMEEFLHGDSALPHHS